ncbi:hypothetical protein LTR86_011165 [Recurvomyces mirabilis]|nr:hypothetical protein LTR86_011165 [Recurvomyces mirabilis]
MAEHAYLQGDDGSVPCQSLPIRTGSKDVCNRSESWDNIADLSAKTSTPSVDLDVVMPPNGLPGGSLDAIEKSGLEWSATASENAASAADTIQTISLQDEASDTTIEVAFPTQETEVDPNGDTLLTLGQENSAVKLRVQSHIVGAASAVLAEKSRYRSWSSLKAGQLHHLDLTGELPCTAQAMKTICNAIHFRSNMDHVVHGPRELVQIGVVSKKYEFTNALRPWSAHWLRQARKIASLPDLQELLEAARMLDAYEEYSRISFDLIRLHIGAFKHGKGLTRDILVHLELRRMSMVLDVSEIVQSATSALSLLSNAGRSEIGSAWARHVCDRGLWPLGRISRTSSVEGVLEELEAFKEPRHLLQGKDPCGCRQPELNLQDKFARARDIVYTSRTGLCLDCIITGGQSMEEGQCRVRHYEGRW